MYMQQFIDLYALTLGNLNNILIEIFYTIFNQHLYSFKENKN